MPAVCRSMRRVFLIPPPAWAGLPAHPKPPPRAPRPPARPPPPWPWLLATIPSAIRPQVDVVGVDGELRDVALKALNTRANFAYSQKEVRRCARCTVGAWSVRGASAPPKRSTCPAARSRACTLAGGGARLLWPGSLPAASRQQASQTMALCTASALMPAPCPQPPPPTTPPESDHGGHAPHV